MTDGFSSLLNSEVCPPHVLELEGGSGKEAVISSDGSWGVVGWSSLNHASIVGVVCKEGILKLSHADSSISIQIVPGNEKLNILSSGEHVDGVESGSDLVGINLSVSGHIEDLKSISEVEVVLLGEHDLSVFKFLLLVAEVLEAVDKFVFVMESEGWLSGWRGSGWASSGDSHWRRGPSGSIGRSRSLWRASL